MCKSANCVSKSVNYVCGLHYSGTKNDLVVDNLYNSLFNHHETFNYWQSVKTLDNNLKKYLVLCFVKHFA